MPGQAREPLPTGMPPVDVLSTGEHNSLHSQAQLDREVDIELL